MTLFAGIDFGTSGARLAVIDGQSDLIAETSQRFGPMDDWATTWELTLKALILQVPVVYRRQIGAIAINGTSSTVLLCGQQGKPLTAPLLYNDARGAGKLAALQEFFAQARYQAARGKATVLNATSSLVKLLWWQDQLYFSKAHYLMHQADWLGFLLHGQLGISDYHNSLKLGYDPVNLSYPDWMEALGLLPLLPRVVTPGTAIGPIQPEIARELGLPVNCQIHAGTTDSIAAFLASGATAPGEAVTSLGSTLVLKLLSRVPVENSQYGIYSHRLGDLWLVGGASNTGGAVLKQFFTAAELAELSDRIDPEQASPLNYYPLLQPGERFPLADPTLQPQLEPRPAEAIEFLHGLLESMARIEARGYELLQQFGANPLVKVYTAGGGAKNPTWTALRARYLQVPVQPSTWTEAAYGTALLAMRGLSASDP